jgi:hypothetical protein
VTRIHSHTIQDAPEASRPLLEGIVSTSPTGKLLNLHAQMARSPAVLAAYASIRHATAAHGTLDPRMRSAVMLATAGGTGSAHAQAVTSLLAARAGLTPSEVLALRDGRALGDDKVDSLAGVAREAAARSGQVSDATWQRAADCGWSSEHLTEAFAFLALTVFTAYFLNYAQTPLDLPAAN